MTEGNTPTFAQSGEQIGYVITHECNEESEVRQMKTTVQDVYTQWGSLFSDKRFMNLGLWDKSVYKEYHGVNFDFSTISDGPDINAQLHLYYMIRPLVQQQFFNQRLLEIGCGNGIGLKASAQLLKTNYALGIDLVQQHVNSARESFYKENELHYIQSDAENLPVGNNSFDIVTNIESSHLYPRIERFFSEVERVLAPGGYFCYADHNVPSRAQAVKFEAFLKKNPHLKVIQKSNITRRVQASIHSRIIANEERFYNLSLNLFGANSEQFHLNTLHLAYAMGLIFLPWWKIWFKRPELHYLAKAARKEKFWGKKYYFYYLVQKVEF